MKTKFLIHSLPGNSFEFFFPNNFKIKFFLHSLQKGLEFENLRASIFASSRKIGISVHPDLSRSILARPGSENHSGSEGWC